MAVKRLFVICSVWLGNTGVRKGCSDPSFHMPAKSPKHHCEGKWNWLWKLQRKWMRECQVVFWFTSTAGWWTNKGLGSED